uniref:Zinc finger protein 292b n=1 Tax=Cyprinus carpio carpio TaxID=630221 RepID=A0A9J7YX86_CYPCA
MPFCTLVEYAGLWKTDEEPLPVLEVYIIALLSFAQASPYLSAPCEEVPVVLESCLSFLSVSFCYFLLCCLSLEVFVAFLSVGVVQSCCLLCPGEKGVSNLMILSSIAREQGVWSNPTLQGILTNDMPPPEKVCEFLAVEGQALLRMRVKHLIKESRVDQAASLAKACAELSDFEEKGHFKQMYLVCLCTAAPQDVVMEELSRVDCRDALEMICNLEADGDEKSAFTLCSGFLTRQILQEDSYCAWQLTLFWGKLLKRLETSEQGFLDRCRQMSFLSKTVFHLLFFIKVIQSEMDKAGLSTCVELCIRALRLESCEGSTKATVCKTISCILPSDLEVKRACQLTEFLLEPTVDSYYAVETLYNEPDQKLDEEELPVPNSLRCELLLVLKTQWPFDPEFWNWKALKRHCLGLMGEEASIVSSIDELNDGDPEGLGGETSIFSEEFKEVSQRFMDTTNELNEIADQRQKNRELKKLREKGFVSARFRNWQAYMQYCVLCDKEFLGHRIVRHAQTHFKDGCYTCPICTETFETRETLEPHVASHVKLSCKERLAAMKTSKQLANPKTAAPVIAALKAKSSENQKVKKTKNNCGGQSNKLSSRDANDSCEGNICPVHSCRRGFKYFRNLVAHVKDHGDNEEAKRFLEMQSTKVVCQYCRRQFVSVDHLNDHLQMHCGTKPYICIQLNCKASFDSNTELIVHKKDHPVFKAKCMFPGCGKIFNEAYKLYDHEAQHYKTFTCKAPDCGKVFHSQSELDLHAEGHVTKVEGQCTDSQSIQPAEPHPDHSNLNDQGCAQPGSLSVIQASYQSMYSSNMTAPTQTSHNATPLVSLGQMLPPVSQTLPLQMASMPNNVQGLENKSVKLVDTIIAQVVKEKERHKCPHESCTRDYSSYRSVTKHMKAVHPDFYTQWKLAKKNNAAVKSTLRSVPVNGSHNKVVKPQQQLGQRVPGPCVQTQNPLVQPPPYLSNCTNSNYPSKLDLDREISEVTRTVDSPVVNDEPLNKPESKDLPSEVRSYVKPFACDTNGCTYSAMTKDALFKHLVKLHNYTDDMLTRVKDQFNVAPFSCQKCSKAFTRNSNLKAHYLTVHNFSQEDIKKMKIKSQSNHRLPERDRGSPCPVPEIPVSVKNTPLMDARQQQNNVACASGSTREDNVKISHDSKDGSELAKPKESPKKTKEKKPEGDDVFSPYRPYRCVHQGCVAAFTIQHNLILHYKAVHQSNEEEAEDKDRSEESGEKLDMDIKEVDEFRCQVKDCSCIFQSVPDLLQHYLQLHKITLEKAGAMMCSINLGRFQCDQPNCSETFTAFWKYISHFDQEHKETKLSKVDPVEGMFRCPMEGCECAYSTRSNLLRHTMKKHQDVYKRLLMNPREGKSGVKLGRPRKYEIDVVEKENRETNKKPIKKGAVKKRKVNKNNWTKYGKPILKTQEEASAMCTKHLQLQYACMIKGCETVTSSERNIMKHYLQHGLPKQYLEEQRSNFIYCKKLPRSRYKRIASRSDDTDNSEESSIETTENEEVAEPGQSESEFSKSTSEKESTEDADLSDGKPSTDTCSEISVVVKRRRGRPRKGERESDKSFGPKRVTRLRTTRSSAVSYVDLNSDSTSSSTTMAQEDASGQNTPLSSFKPMGFEVSFLQFLQESKTSQKRKATVPLNGNSRKKMAAFHLKTATVVCKRSDAQLHSREVLQLVEFKNPQKLTSLSNVTFEVQKVFSSVFEILLKQLHEMRPTVILQKED